TWDALNRLISITYSGGASSNFAYDGLSRRTSIIEKNSSGTVTSTKNYLWIGSEIAEERDADNNVTKRFFPQGEQQSGTNYYYTRDQVASVREMLNGSGTIVARYGYDAFGAPLPGYSTNLISGTNLATFQYATMMMHQPSGISFTRNVPGFDGREYNPSVGWISRDPLGEGWDATLYSYVYNNPIWAFDPFGLAGPGRHFSPATNTVVINDPLGAFLLFLLGNHTPAEIGSGLAGALATLQKENSDYFPKTTCPTNVTWYSYGSWNHPLDTLDAMLTLGQYRYNNDGTTTTISDFYSFPFSQDDNYGGTTYHNAGLSPLGIINSGYPVSGQYPTP
ncbi:MAG TPA: hypothetical protein VL981_00935, partial [Candidatus Methylacidiphilales bacterium]|nr:hypothetical protein [Candidatus Methylacidiphilales bacterium]